jgi:hypothetical protein
MLDARLGKEGQEMSFTFEVIDLETEESQGFFETLDEARGCVRFNRLRAYSIWREDDLDTVGHSVRVEHCDPYTGDDDRVKQALGQPNESEAEPSDMADRSIPSDPLHGLRMDSADLGEN